MGKYQFSYEETITIIREHGVGGIFYEPQRKLS